MTKKTKIALFFLTLFLFVASLGLVVVGIWTGDSRWTNTGFLFGLPLAFALMITAIGAFE